MTNQLHLRVSNPPPKPLMIWDGECHFCKRWVERWREITAGEVDYATYQEAAHQFPEIPIEQFKRAVTLIEPDGKTFFAAEAVYRSLRYRSSRKWLTWSYDHIPGFAAVSETAYKFIARHRGLGSTVTRMLWGKDVRPPTYFWARRWFLRALGVIYLIAFVSLWVQVDGLIGSDGVSPVNQFLPAVHAQLGKDAYALLPTLCWFNSSKAFLHFLCGGGVVLSVLLIFGIAPALSLVALFAFYLSLTIAGQIFLSFQWDILLLETGFLSIFLAPWRLWPRELIFLPGSPPPATAAPVSRAGLLLIDDAAVGTDRHSVGIPTPGAPSGRALAIRLCGYASIAVVVVTLPINAWLIFSAFKPRARPPHALATVYEQLEAFRIVNGYGLFRVMTKDRCEIVLEGSTDGVEWLPYEFKWKPGDVKRAPGWCAPHQPRLDWQMWFAALERPQQNPWLVGLIVRLLQGSDDVSRLLAHNPFPERPPRYIRAMFYRYRFTTVSELRQNGTWWKRQQLREYLPTVSLDQLRQP